MSAVSWASDASSPLLHHSGRIQISSNTHELLLEDCSPSLTAPTTDGRLHPEWEPTGGVEVKGKGVMDTYVWDEAAAMAALMEEDGLAMEDMVH